MGAVVVLMGAGCGDGRLGTTWLSQQSKSLQSLAAEAALVAEDAVAGKTTRVYVRERSVELREAASQIEASLQTAETQRELQPILRRLRRLAARISMSCGRLAGTSDREQRMLGRVLEAAARDSRRISERLK